MGTPKNCRVRVIVSIRFNMDSKYQYVNAKLNPSHYRVYISSLSQYKYTHIHLTLIGFYLHCLVNPLFQRNVMLFPKIFYNGNLKKQINIFSNICHLSPLWLQSFNLGQIMAVLSNHDFRHS